MLHGLEARAQGRFAPVALRARERLSHHKTCLPNEGAAAAMYNPRPEGDRREAPLRSGFQPVDRNTSPNRTLVPNREG